MSQRKLTYNRMRILVVYKKWDKGYLHKMSSLNWVQIHDGAVYALLCTNTHKKGMSLFFLLPVEEKIELFSI